jgi:hypothetical protein
MRNYLLGTVFCRRPLKRLLTRQLTWQKKKMKPLKKLQRRRRRSLPTAR